MADRKLIQAVEAYFTDLRLVRGSGGATDERSLYVPLAIPTLACTPPGRCRRATRSRDRSRSAASSR